MTPWGSNQSNREYGISYRTKTISSTNQLHGGKKKSQGSKGKGIVPVFKRVLRYFKKNKWKAGSYLNLDLDKPTIKKVGE